MPAGQGLHFTTQNLSLQPPASTPAMHMEQPFPQSSGWAVFLQLFSLLVGSSSSSQRLFGHIWWICLLKKAFWSRDSSGFDPSSSCAAVTYVVNKHEGDYTNRNPGSSARREGTANPLCTEKNKKLNKNHPNPPPNPKLVLSLEAVMRLRTKNTHKYTHSYLKIASVPKKKKKEKSPKLGSRVSKIKLFNK